VSGGKYINLGLFVCSIYSEVEVDSTDGRYSVDCDYPTQTKEIGFDPEIVFDEPVDGASIKKLKDDEDGEKKDKKKDEKKSENRATRFSDADRNPLIEINRAKAIRANARQAQKAGQVLVNNPAVVTTNMKAAEGLLEGDIVVVTDEHEVTPGWFIYEVSKGNRFALR